MADNTKVDPDVDPEILEQVRAETAGASMTSSGALVASAKKCPNCLAGTMYVNYVEGRPCRVCNNCHNIERVRIHEAPGDKEKKTTRNKLRTKYAGWLLRGRQQEFTINEAFAKKLLDGAGILADADLAARAADE